VFERAGKARTRTIRIGKLEEIGDFASAPSATVRHEDATEPRRTQTDGRDAKKQTSSNGSANLSDEEIERLAETARETIEEPR
jgi:hypothetical protein